MQVCILLEKTKQEIRLNHRPQQGKKDYDKASLERIYKLIKKTWTVTKKVLLSEEKSQDI